MKEIAFTAPHERMTLGQLGLRLSSVASPNGAGLALHPAVAAAHAAIDHGAIEAEQRKRIRILLFEPGDTINGMDPVQDEPNAMVRERHRRLLASGVAYCLEVDGHITVFQPHLPAAGYPPIPRDKVEAVANAHAAQVLTGMVHEKVLEAAAEHIITHGGLK
jgi:hypothetical protein